MYCSCVIDASGKFGEKQKVLKESIIQKIQSFPEKIPDSSTIDIDIFHEASDRTVYFNYVELLISHY